MLAVSARALVFVFWPWGFCCYCRCRSSPPGAASVRGSSRIPPAAPMRSGDQGRCCRPSRWLPVSMTSSPACSACRVPRSPPADRALPLPQLLDQLSGPSPQQLWTLIPCCGARSSMAALWSCRSRPHMGWQWSSCHPPAPRSL
jgi:hypothetical protein